MIKIFIDPGHGGTDRSNKGRTGYVEADGMLDLCLKLKDELLKTGKFDVKMSRTTDATVAVRERGNMAARWGANMFISNHSNAIGGSTPNSTARGVDVYYSVDIPSDITLAKKFVSEISKAMGTRARSALTRESTTYPGEDYYGVIDAAQDGGVPHVFLIENGFHDNLEDEALLKNPEVRLKMAKAQAKVICDFYGVEYEPEKKIVAGIVTATELNVRPAPVTSNTPITTLKNGQLVEVLLREGDWYQIKVGDIKGYVSTKYIYGLDDKQKIVKEAFDLGLIKSDEWIEKPEERAEIWFMCATGINILNKLGIPTPIVDESDWRKRIVKEAYEMGLILSDEWIDKPTDKTRIWFNCAIYINILEKFGTKKPKIEDSSWERRVVKEAYEMGLIKSTKWFDTPTDLASAWFICATTINTLNAIQK